MERLYSIPDAATALGGVSKKTIEMWLTKGKLRRTKVGRRTVIRESELQRFIQSGPDLKTSDAVTKTL
jgi:excisionase family DNA binding protein